MDPISMYDRGHWSSKSDTLRQVVGLTLVVALGLVPPALLLLVLI